MLQRKLSGIIYLFIFFILFSCSNKKEFEIEGNISNAQGRFLKLYKLTAEESLQIDSVNITEEGYFKFTGEISEPTFFRMNLLGGNYLFFILHPDEKVRIKADGYDMQASYSLEGSYGSSILRDYMKQFDFAYKEKVRIADNARFRMESGENIDTVRQEAISRHEILKTNITNFTREYIEKNKCMLASVFVLDLQLGPNDPILTMENDFEYFSMVDSCLSLKYPNLNIVQAFNKSLIRFKEEKGLNKGNGPGIGAMAPEIALPDTLGDTIVLSSLKGNYVLLDFWASWNKESANINEHLKEIYRTYHQMGFNIYQVSLDKSKSSWQKGIAGAGLPWINVCDMKFWDSPVVNLYKVYSIPANYLIDRNGNIIDYNIYGDELENKLSSILKTK